MKSEHKIVLGKYTVEYSAGEETAGTHISDNKIKIENDSNREFYSHTHT